MTRIQEQSNGQLSALIRCLGHLWRAYGGWRVLARSPYVWGSCIATVGVTYFKADGWNWHSTCLAVLPDLLGFSLGGYAILLAFGDGRFLDALRGPEPDGSASPYLQTSASLAWFVLCQICALIVSIFSESTAMSLRLGTWQYCLQWIGLFLGCWLFMYAILLSVAAALAIFFLSWMYDDLPQKKEELINIH